MNNTSLQDDVASTHARARLRASVMGKGLPWPLSIHAVFEFCERSADCISNLTGIRAKVIVAWLAKIPASTSKEHHGKLKAHMDWGKLELPPIFVSGRSKSAMIGGVLWEDPDVIKEKLHREQIYTGQVERGEPIVFIESRDFSKGFWE